ncbi:hypothetical protein [Nocardioides sp. GCM10030258]|uniref:hypothetical protein n=1 Tax=unclassified Nocardioides TaxID=2615069 RepID=UPI0036141FE9
MNMLRPARILAWCAVVLILGHIAGLVAREGFDVYETKYGLIRQFDLNAEGNLAAWFSSFLLICSAALCLLVAQVRRLRQEAIAGRWAILSAFLLVMAIDETAQLHDMASRPLRNGLGLDFGVLYFAWLIPALLIVGGAAFYFAPVVRNLSDAIRPQLIVAVVVYLAGAVGFEMVGGSVVDEGRQSLTYLAVMTLEESLEILGGFLFLTALLNQVRELRPALVLRWTGELPELTLAEDRAASPTEF